MMEPKETFKNFEISDEYTTQYLAKPYCKCTIDDALTVLYDLKYYAWVQYKSACGGFNVSKEYIDKLYGRFRGIAECVDVIEDMVKGKERNNEK